MRRYRSHKVVEAAPIHAIGVGDVTKKLLLDNFVEIIEPGDDRGVIERVEVPANFFARGTPQQGDYLVRYEDGYLSWSPKQAFEDGYTAVSDE